MCNIFILLFNSTTRYILYNVETGQSEDALKGYECLKIWDNIKVYKGANNETLILKKSDSQVIYQSPSYNLKVTNLDYYKGNLKDVLYFHCSKDEWVDKIPEMINLKELILYNLKIDTLPDISDFKFLETLKIDGCRNLKKIEGDFYNLKKLSLRSCTSMKGVTEFVKDHLISKLFIINMDLTEVEKQLILNKVKGTVISGNAKSADYKLQEVIDGF